MHPSFIALISSIIESIYNLGTPKDITGWSNNYLWYKLNSTTITDSSGNGKIEGNFGGTQSFTISSGNADDNGYGNFEYDVPTGFYSLNTKNLSEFG